MTDYLPFPPPNALGEAFSESGIGGGGGGGGSNVYTLSASVDEIVLTPTPAGATSSVDVATLPSVGSVVAKTARISSADNINTYMTGGIRFDAVSPSIRPEIEGLLNVKTDNVIINTNVITTSGTGGTASLRLNGNIIAETPATWANYEAISNVVIPNSSGVQPTLQINPNNYNAGLPFYTYPTSVINQNLQVGQPSIIPNNAPNISFYPTDFIVGDDTLLGTAPARSINLYSGAGGTSIRALQGIALRAGVDINLTATADINLLAAATTIEGAVNIVGATNTTGNVSIEGGFEVAGVVALGGATTITGETNITGLTTITGGLAVSGVADLNGGCAVVGGLGVAGITSLTGNLTQTGGDITTTGNVKTLAITSDGTLNIAPLGNMALVNLSSINGQPYVPATNTPWYNVPAQANVNMGTNILSNVSGLEAPTSGGSSNISLLSPSGQISISAPAGVNISGSAGVNINSDVGINVNGLLNANRIAVVGSTIVGISTINGLPYGGSASSWADFPATNNVNIAGSNINNVRNINVQPGQNFSLANSLTATNIQGGSQLNLTGVANGANVSLTAGTGANVVVNSPLVITASSIVGVSSINGAVYPPTGGSAWYNVPAGGNVNMVNYNLSNIGNLFSPAGDISFIVGGGNQTSYVKFNDNGSGYWSSGSSNPNMTFTTTNTDPAQPNGDNIYFNTNAVRIKGGLEVMTGDLVCVGAGTQVEANIYSVAGTGITLNNSGLTLNGSGVNIDINEPGSYIQFPDNTRQYTAYPFPYIPGTAWAIGQTWVFNGISLPQLPVPVSTDPPPANQNIGAMDYTINPICNRSPATSYPFSAVSGDSTTFQTNSGGIYRLTFSCDATQQLPSPLLTCGGFSLSLRNNATGATISGQMCGQFQQYLVVGGANQIYVIAPTCGTFTGVLLANTSYSMYLANPPYASFGIRGLALDNIKWAWEYLGQAQP